MKKTLIISSILASALMADVGSKMEIAPYVGGHFFNNNRDMKNSVEGGLILEKALTESGIAVAGSLGYTKTEKESNSDDKKVGTYGLNLIKNYDLGTKLTPYLGVGVAGTFWESVKVGPNVLAGLKYKLSDAMNIRAEVSDNYLLNGKNDVKALVGLGFLFGAEKPKPAPVAVPIPKEEPMKVVEAPKPAPVPAPIVDGDEDGDGVKDSKDMCPHTLKGLKVDDKGCFHSANLMVNFDIDKAIVKKEYMPKLEAFANFLNKSEPVNVIIEGHTSSPGSVKHNQTLSEKRANAVMDILIKEYKVEASRLKAVGYGELKPIADNKTKAGRAENRRMMAVVDKATQVPTTK